MEKAKVAFLASRLVEIIEALSKSVEEDNTILKDACVMTACARLMTVTTMMVDSLEEKEETPTEES